MAVLFLKKQQQKHENISNSPTKNISLKPRYFHGLYMKIPRLKIPGNLQTHRKFPDGA